MDIVNIYVKRVRYVYIHIFIAFKYIPYWAAALSRPQLLELGYLHIGELAYTDNSSFELGVLT